MCPDEWWSRATRYGCCSIDRLIDCSIVWLVGWLFDLLIVRFVDWLIDWWLCHHGNLHSLDNESQRVIKIFSPGCFLSLGIRSKASHQVRFGRLGKALRSGTDIDWYDSQGKFSFVFRLHDALSLSCTVILSKISLLNNKRQYLFLQFLLILQ